MKRSNFALRLQPALLDEARKLAEAEGVALNQLINVAVAEKLSALRTEAYFAERAARANVAEAIELVKSSGGATRRPGATSWGMRTRRTDGRREAQSDSGVRVDRKATTACFAKLTAVAQSSAM
jgi:hypothetical protein